MAASRPAQTKVYATSRITLSFLPFQKVYFVDRNRLAIAEHRYDNAKSYRGFCRRHDDDEYCEHRSGERIYREPLRRKHFLVQLKVARECNQVEVDRIQDQLDRHEDDDDVAARQDPGDSNNEQ